MTDKQAIKLAKRVEFWQKELASLGLGHWRIEGVTCTDDMPGGPNTLAGVRPSDSYTSVYFWFLNSHIEDSTVREIDETIVHEWLHVMMRDLDSAIEAVEDQLAPVALEFWKDRVVHEREAVVDMLARDIVTRFYAAKA